MLNLVNILTLSTALTTQPLTQDIQLVVSGSNEQLIVNTSSTLVKEEKYTNAFKVIVYNNDETKTEGRILNDYTSSFAITASYVKTEFTKIAIGYEDQKQDISKYSNFNPIETINNTYVFTNTIKNFTGNGTYTTTINIRSKPFMEELLTALTTAVQSAVSIFVEGFGGLTQIFYNGTEITFIGGILVVGLAVMFLMMFLRWIVSFVKGI